MVDVPFSEFEQKLLAGEIPKDIAPLLFSLHKDLSSVSDGIKELKDSIERFAEKQVEATTKIFGLEDSLNGVKAMTYSIKDLEGRMSRVEKRVEEWKQDAKTRRNLFYVAVVSAFVAVMTSLIKVFAG